MLDAMRQREAISDLCDMVRSEFGIEFVDELFQCFKVEYNTGMKDAAFLVHELAKSPENSPEAARVLGIAAKAIDDLIKLNIQTI